MTAPRTMFEKIWDRHVIVKRGENEALLHVDRNFVHEGSFHAFGALAAEGRKVRKPRQTFATADHYVPTRNRERGIDAVTDPEMRNMLELFAKNTQANGIENYYGLDDPRQGIVHVVGPELGITQPGLVITCGDSHTSTHGAFGAFAVGIGASQLKQILATQCLWQKKPKTLRISVDGALPPGVTAKDIILAIIARIGTAGATGCAIEYAGSAIRGAQHGRPSDRLQYVDRSRRARRHDRTRRENLRLSRRTRIFAKGRALGQSARVLALAAHRRWRALRPRSDARRDHARADGHVGHEPGGSGINCHRSPRSRISSRRRQTRAHGAGAALHAVDAGHSAARDIKIDRAFIGTCTNGRIEDLRAAAAVLKGRKIVVPAWVSPGSSTIKRQAEAEGLDRIFREAGFEWRASGCSGCAAMNEDTVPAGERCASTSNRNFEGRQGKGARTHLMSPAMVAAAAVTGRLTDVRKLMS